MTLAWGLIGVCLLDFAVEYGVRKGRRTREGERQVVARVEERKPVVRCNLKLVVLCAETIMTVQCQLCSDGHCRDGLADINVKQEAFRVLNTENGERYPAFYVHRTCAVRDARNPERRRRSHLSQAVGRITVDFLSMERDAEGPGRWRGG